MNRLSKSLIILGALLVWYALFGFLIAPPLIRHFGEAQLQETFSEDSAIAKVRINPFSGSLRVEGLQMADASGAWSLAWQEAEVNISALTLLKFYPVVDALRLVGADVHFEKRAAEQPEEEDPKTADAADAKGWRDIVETLNLAEIPEVRIDLLEVTDGRVDFTDRTAAELFEKTINPVNFTLRDFTTVVEGDTAMRFVAETEEGASLSWEGDFQSRPIRSSGTLSLSGFSIQDLSPYYTRYIRFELKRAIFSFDFDYRLDLSDMENLFSIEGGQVALSDVLCEPVAVDDQLISIQTIRAEGVDFRFPEMALELSGFHIEDGETRIARTADGQINLARLVVIPESTGEPEPAQPAPDADTLPALSYQIAEASLRDYRIVWEDALEAGTANLSVDVPKMDVTGLSSDLDTAFQLTADYVIGESGKAHLEGSVTPAGPVVDLDMDIESVRLFLLSPYAQKFGQTAIREGTFDFSGRFEYAPDGAQSLTGEAAIRQIDFTYDGSLEANWSALTLDGMRLDLAPFAVAMETVTLEQPDLVYTRRASPAEPTKSEPPAASGEVGADASLPLRIGELAIAKGRLTFEDARFDPQTQIVMEPFELKLSGLDLGGAQPAQLSLSTQINGSPFTIDGDINANRYKEATRLKASLTGLSLPPLSPYSGQAVGRRIAAGSFDLESDWTIESSQLKASNKIRIDQFKLGDSVPSENAVSLPLDLAVTLLKGPGGVMDLSLPLSGDLSDPKVGIGQIVRTAIVGLITNVATAPFKMLSGLVGAEEDLSIVSFAPGSSELSPDMIERLNALAKALKERPGLQLTITPQISAADDSRLAETKLRMDLLGDTDPDDEAAYERRLTRRYREAMAAAGTPDRATKADDPGGLETMLATLLPGVELEDAERSALAADRAAAIRQHLETAQGIDPERLDIQPPEIGTSDSGAEFDLK